ncbi:Ionotropic receptor 139 [Blattella germanica]|nr:Ionotropic receptor 139 [Blattella germanica]
MKYRIFIIVILIPVITTIYGYIDKDVTLTEGNFISALRDYFQSGCVNLVYNKAKEYKGSHKYITDLMKHLSVLKVPTAVFVSSQMNTTAWRRCKHNRPINVILGDTPNLQPVLPEEIWILYQKTNGTSAKNLLENVQAPFDSEFLIARSTGNATDISEVYQLYNNQSSLEYHFGSWTDHLGLKVTNLTFNKRRSDLKGVTLSATVLHNPPSVRLLESDDGTLHVNGIIGHAFGILKDLTNFNIPREAKWGVPENGTWDGMIGEIQRKEVDMAVNGFFMTSKRMDILDFTLPLLYTRYSIFIREPDNKSTQWGNFLAPFSSKLWIAVLTAIVVLALFLALLYYCGRRYGNQEAEDSSRYDLYDYFLYIFGVFCSQGHYLSPRSNSCRLVYLLANLTAVVLLAAYSGTLISFLTVHNYNFPFTDLDGLLAENSYDLGVYNIPDEWYKTNESFPKLNKAYMKTMANDPQGYPMTALEGLQKVCNNKYAFLLPMDTALALSNDINCSLVALPHGSFQASLSIALPKRSPYRGLLSYKLHELRDTGIIHRLRQREWAPQYEKPQPWKRVGLEEAIPIFVILIFGVLASCLLLFLERRYTSINLKMEVDKASTVTPKHEPCKCLYRYQHFKYPLNQDKSVREAYPFFQ